MTDFTPDGFRKLANRYHVASKESVALHQAADALDQRGRELAECRAELKALREQHKRDMQDAANDARDSATEARWQDRNDANGEPHGTY